MGWALPQFDGGIFTNEIPSSQVCLGLCRVDKNYGTDDYTS